MDEVYKSRRIHTTPLLNIETDCWVPSAEISWEEEGKACRQILAGPSDRYKIIDHAEIYAVEMAKTWIDIESIGDLTP